MDAQAEVLQGPILGSLFLFFLIYINHLTDNLASNLKLWADHNSLFPTLTDLNATVIQINNDLHNINKWNYHWEVNFQPDTSKQAQEVVFSCGIKGTAHPQLVFNNDPVYETSTQKRLGIFLD